MTASKEQQAMGGALAKALDRRLLNELDSTEFPLGTSSEASSMAAIQIAALEFVVAEIMSRHGDLVVEFAVRVIERTAGLQAGKISSLSLVDKD